MRKILYIVSTLKRSGPTNQLFNVINHLDRSQFEPHLVTLSPEPADNRWKEFQDINVKLYSLKLSRLQGLLFAKYKLGRLIEAIKPDLIHTQGIRADAIVSSLGMKIPHVATIHNFAPDDYISKFGGLKGRIMVKHHFNVMRKSKYLIACSKTISHKLHSVGIESVPIQNGVELVLGDSTNVAWVNQLPRPLFVSVGSLIPRKNMSYLIDTFNRIEGGGKGSLVILGDGVLMDELKSIAGNNVHFVGNVVNVPDYLAAADYFVSTSFSEGLPNTVLEALAAGVPAILSNIDSHIEIFKESEKASYLVKLDDEGHSLFKVLKEPEKYFDGTAKVEAQRIANGVFSASVMSQQYQQFYLKVIDDE